MVYSDSFDSFTFMMILLFVYLVLILFIFMLIYNNIHGTKKELVSALSSSKSNNNATTTTCSNCIPSPTPLLGESKYY
jgi:hypothetical protein